MSGKRLGRLLKEQTMLFNCDIQTGFMKHLYKGEHIVNTARQMVQTAGVMNLPILVTEQNVKVFGNTVPELSNDFPKNLIQYYEKSSFSMINEQTEAFLKANSERKSVILYGAEAHVCVQQTCLDLLDRGYEVHLLTDGITSINSLDRTTAFERMRDAGAFLTTFQSVVFELMKSHTSPDFKKMLPIIKLKTTEDRLGHL
ncbi:hypothetical protein ABPG74_001409 [Tetrahymena malaccensis]